MSTESRVNNQIRGKEVRVIDPEGNNLGVLSVGEALVKAREFDLDLIEISPHAKPPVAKIADYGKFRYQESKKKKTAKAKAHSVEVKNVQVKVGTSEHDLALKARKSSEWLSEGHRVKVDLFLPGRAKYLDRNFLRERLERLLKLMTVEYNIAEDPKKSPKGLTMLIEKK